ncbi:uncharacterized protein LOC143179563 [Calliopsis andreniformis]|uniref:uncharacterized protein LOC143179563 n=1 Tax=Calliopsis andreniformis TaxID=337506 RepID=UPI003FCDD76D
MVSWKETRRHNFRSDQRDHKLKLRMQICRNCERNFGRVKAGSSTAQYSCKSSNRIGRRYNSYGNVNENYYEYVKRCNLIAITRFKHERNTAKCFVSSFDKKVFYLILKYPIELPLCPNLEVSSVYLKKNILEALRQLFGEEGTKSTIDILKYNSKEHRFVLRCNKDCYVRLRAALTLAQKYEGNLCTYIIHSASPNLLSFTANSRNYQH